MEIVFGKKRPTALVDHPDVALITFTGSPEVGWGIRARAPRKRVGLELGNNAPCIIEADGDAQDEWMSHVAAMASDTLFQTADSWYVGANIPGKARGFNFYIGPGYISRCNEVAANGYLGFTLA